MEAAVAEQEALLAMAEGGQSALPENAVARLERVEMALEETGQGEARVQRQVALLLVVLMLLALALEPRVKPPRC